MEEQEQEQEQEEEEEEEEEEEDDDDDEKGQHGRASVATAPPHTPRSSGSPRYM